MRSKAPGISPAKIAIAVQLTIAAIAGTGCMKKVTGTSKAVAIVAESPGMAPTKRPKTDERAMTHSTSGCRIRSKAASNAVIASPQIGRQRTARQRHQQQAREQKPDRGHGKQAVEQRLDRKSTRLNSRHKC